MWLTFMTLALKIGTTPAKAGQDSYAIMTHHNNFSLN